MTAALRRSFMPRPYPRGPGRCVFSPVRSIRRTPRAPAVSRRPVACSRRTAPTRRLFTPHGTDPPLVHAVRRRPGELTGWLGTPAIVLIEHVFVCCPSCGIWPGRKASTVGGRCLSGVMEGPTFSPSSPAAVAAAANTQLRELDEVLWAAKAPEEIVAAVAECEALRSHLAALEAAALAEVEDRKIARRQLAWSSTGDWFTHTAGTHRRLGTRAVRHAKLLVAERSLTRDALRDGLVSPEQAAVICDAVEELPTSPVVRERAEKTLIEEAGRLHAGDLAKAARHLIHVADPEAAERQAERELAAQDRAAHRHRFLAITDDGAGGVRLKGRGTAEDGARLKAAR